MQRRAFVLLTAGGLAGGLPTIAAANTNAGGTAGARIGARILATFPLPVLEALSKDQLEDAPGSVSDTLRRRIAADHRAGRIIKVDGVSLAVSEAAWCLAQAQGALA